MSDLDRLFALKNTMINFSKAKCDDDMAGYPIGHGDVTGVVTRIELDVRDSVRLCLSGKGLSFRRYWGDDLADVVRRCLEDVGMTVCEEAQ